MAEAHVVSAVVPKQGELAGEVQRHRLELRRLDEQLGHLVAAIRLFAPDYDVSGVRPRQRRAGRRRFGQPECRRAQDGKRDIRVAVSPCARRQPLCRGSACGCRRARLPAGSRGTTGPTNGLTACRTRSACRLRWLRDHAPQPLRQHSRAYAYPGLRAHTSLSLARSGGSPAPSAGDPA
jgi:hypothetical protein